MHDRQWVRIGFAFVLASTGVMAASVAGCGDDNGPGAMPGNDASNDMTMPEPDTGVQPDTSVGGDTGQMNGEGGEAAAPLPHAKIFVAHASETAPAVRFCFGVATAPDGGTISVVSQFYAEPQNAAPGLPYPGVFPGTGGLLNDHGIDLSTFNIAAYAIDATKIANDTEAGGPEGGAEHNCAQLVGATGSGGELKLGTDYWLLGIIPAGTLAKGSSWVFAITGCPAGAPTAEVPFCGMGYDPASSNLGFTPFKLDSVATAPSNQMGAQLVQASWQWDAVKGLVTQQHAGVTSVAAFFNLVDAGAPPTDSGAPDTGAPDTGTVADSAADTGAASDASSDAAEDATTSDAAADSGGGVVDSGGGGMDSGGGFSCGSSGPGVTPVLPPLASAMTTEPKFGSVTPTMMLNVSGLLFDGTSGLSMAYLNPSFQTCGPTVGLPLPAIQQFTYGTSGGIPFANGMTFAFVLVGNPLEPLFVDAISHMPCAPGSSATCIPNGYAAHFLAFPAYNQQ
jgi:hypothetical protein